MIHGERTKRRLHWDRKGLTGTIVMLCDWCDVDPELAIALPHVGDPWPGIGYLTCVDVQMDECDCGECEYSAQYSTDRQLGEDFYEASLEVSGETIDRTKGYTWETAQTPVTIDIPTAIPMATYTVRVKLPSVPKTGIVAAYDKVNSKVLHGFAVETLRFDGASTDESYDLSGNIVSVQTVYRFTWRPWSHNYAWRDPLQMRDIDGNPVFYQNIDSGEPYYTTDQRLIATPVWVSGTPGSGAWDKPKDGSSKYRYDTCDFAAVLGIAKMLGDG